MYQLHPEVALLCLALPGRGRGCGRGPAGALFLQPTPICAIINTHGRLISAWVTARYCCCLGPFFSNANSLHLNMRSGFSAEACADFSYPPRRESIRPPLVR